jgi:peptidyl-prolyl cis-trans isomerase B (cyclophilin B)
LFAGRAARAILGGFQEERAMKTATIETDRGVIKLELFEKDAPGTVANFEKLAKKGYYDGLTFHRVIADFMIQGGCPKGTGTGGPGYTIKCETANNPRRHGKGALSMAHAGKDTGGSQFFITHRATPHLDGVHTVFGQVISGQEVVDAIRVGDHMKKVTIADG